MMYHEKEQRPKLSYLKDANDIHLIQFQPAEHQLWDQIAEQAS